MVRSDLEEMNSNQWTINLSSLCEAASCSDLYAVRSYLIGEEDPSLHPQQHLFTESPPSKPMYANSSPIQTNSTENCTNNHCPISPPSSELIPTSDQACALIEFLSFLLLHDDDTDTVSNVDTAVIARNSHLRERKKMKRKFLEYFSVNNEHSSILSLSSESFQQINYNSNGKFEKQQQQLLMSFRSLLLLPPFHSTPWGIIQTAVRAIQQQSLIKSSKNESFFRNDSFAFRVLLDIRNFMRSICDGFSSLSKINNSDRNDHVDNNGSASGPMHIRVAAIEDCLIKVFTQIIKPFFHPVESQNCPAFGDDNSSSISNDNEKVETYNCYHLEKSFEIVEPLLEAGKSIDFCHDRNIDTDWTVVVQCMDNLYLNPGQVCKKRLRSDMIVPLLVLSRKISKHLNVLNWCHLRGLVYDGLINDDVITPSGYGEIFELIITFAVSANDGQHTDDEYCQSYPSWSELIVEMYCISRTKKRILNSVESQLKMSVINLPMHTYRILVKDIINVWRHYHDEEKKSCDFEESHLVEIRIPQWACLNILFIILHGQIENDSQLVGNLLSDSIYIDKRQFSRKEEALTALLSAMNLDNENGEVNYTYETIERRREELRSFFHDVSCDTKGKVKINSASHLSKKFGMLIQSIGSCVSFYRTYLHETNNMDLDDMLKERVHIFSDIGSSILQLEKCDGDILNVFLLGAAVFVELFAEVPPSRSMLIHRFVDIICNDYEWSCKRDIQAVLDPKQVCCWIISSFANILAQIYSDAWTKEGIHLGNEDMCFQPLYDLLSGKTQEILSLEIANELIYSLSHLPSGRKAILDFAQLNLHPRNLNDIKEQHSVHGDNIHHYSKTDVALKAFLSLIRENNKGKSQCPSDEISLQALGQVSNFIALNRPAISLSNRSLFFYELGSLVESYQINSWVSERLLGAALWALLNHFSFASTSNKFLGLVFTPNCEVDCQSEIVHEHLSLLTRLAMLLIQSRAQFQLTDSLSSTVLTSEEANLIVESSLFMKETRQHETIIHSRLSIRSIALSCFGAMIRYILQMSCTHAHLPNENSLKLPTATACVIQSQLCESEAKSWTAKIIELSKDRKKVGPIWTETLRPCWVSMLPSQKLTEVQSIKLFPIHGDLTKLLIDASNTILAVNKQQLDDIEKERLVHLSACIRILQSVKRNVLTSQKSTNMIRITSPLHPNVLLGEECMVGTRFFINAAQSIEISIRASACDYKELIHLEELMNTTSQFCETLSMAFEYCNQSDCDEGNLVLCMEFLRTMWSYYNSSCSEIVLCDFIDFIEARSRKESAKVPDHFVNISSHKPFESMEIIYEFVRNYRFSFVSCFGIIFNFNRINSVWEKNMDSFFLLCIDIACTLSQDLHSGLNALSGGITQSFYRCVIQIIEDVIQGAIQIPIEKIIQSNDDFDSELLLDLRNSCVAASSAHWNLISSFDFKSNQLLKYTIRTSLMLLPQLHQKIDRVALLNFTSAAMSDHFFTRIHSSVDFRAPLLLELCIQQINEDVLVDGAGKRRKYLENSLELIGKRQVGRGLRDKLSTSSKFLGWTTEQLMIVIERLWTNERQDGISCNGVVVSNTNIFDLFPAIKTYTAKRLRTLRESLSAIVPLFLTAKATENESGVDRLSFSAKRRLCSCIERIFLTLKTSLRTIIRCIDGSDSCSKDELTLNMQVALAESISCVLSWLMTSNFTVTIRTYYSKLADIKTTKEQKSQRFNNDLIHARLTKAIHKIEEVEEMLTKMVNALKEDKDAESSLDSLVTHVIGYCSEIFENYEETTMYEMIQKYFCVSSGLSRSRDTNNKNSASKKRLQKVRRGRQRSRNDVVDEWMNLDFELNEEGKNDDNYEDLEDWILPG